MTKQEEIQEMAAIIDKAREEAMVTLGSLNEGFGMWYARKLYEKDYRKIKKGEVVLSAEENSDYIVLRQNYEFVKGENERLQNDNKRIYKNLAKFKEVVHKETARKVFDKIKIELLCSDIADDRPKTEYRFRMVDLMKIAKKAVEEVGGIKIGVEEEK